MFSLITVATVIRVRKLVAARRDHDDPARLATEDAHLDAYLAGVVLGLMLIVMGFVALGGPFSDGPGAATVLVLLLVWALGNIVVGTLMVVTIVRSRRRAPQVWQELDFIEEHLPRNGQPPGTVEEYAALRLKAESKKK